MISDVAFTIDGSPVQFADDWAANANAMGGSDQFRASLPLDALMKLPSSVGQFSVVTASIADTGRIFWQGEMVAEPIRDDDSGLARVAAQGPFNRFRKRSQRRLYQSRDYQLWAEAQNPPFGYAVPSTDIEKIIPKVGKYCLLFEVPPGINADSATAALCVWTPGTAINRIAFDYVTNDGDKAKYTFAVYNAWGPDISAGLGTGLTSHNLATAVGSMDLRAGYGDMIIITLTHDNTADLTNARVVQFNNVRIGGIALSDWMSGTDAARLTASDVGGFDTSQIPQGSGRVNILPLDWPRQSWDGLVNYLAEIEDNCWPIGFDYGSGYVFRFQPFGEHEHVVNRSNASWGGLEPLERFNGVIVHYALLNGMPGEYVRMANPDPFRGKRTNLYEFTLSDPQADDTLASQLASNLLGYWTSQRYQGSIAISRAHFRSSDNRSVYEIQPGDWLTVADWRNAAWLERQRIYQVDYSINGVSATIHPTDIDARMNDLRALSSLLRFEDPFGMGPEATEFFTTHPNVLSAQTHPGETQPPAPTPMPTGDFR